MKYYGIKRAKRHEDFMYWYARNSTKLKTYLPGQRGKLWKRDYDFIFKELPSEITVGRYHSLSLVGDTLPDCLEIISKAKDDGEIMAVKHKDFNVYGLQFHPESILTPDGLTIIKNFIEKVNRGIL